MKAPKIINTGYLKLDHVRRKLDLINNKKDSILLAPTGNHSLKNFNISNDILNKLVNSDYTIIKSIDKFNDSKVPKVTVVEE